MTIRIVATADNHLGRYYARMPVRILDERRRRIRRAFGQAVDRAIETRAHLFLIAGDLFDNPNPRNPERIYLARRLFELQRAGVQVVAIAGNHDVPRSSTEEGGYPPLALYKELGALHFFDQLPEDREVKPVVLDCDGARVAVGGWTPDANLPADRDPLEDVRLAETGASLRVLLVHHGVEGTMYPGSEALMRRETLKDLRGVDLVVAGNVHSFETFRAGEAQIVIPGATEWMDFGEGRTVTPGFAELEVEDGGAVRVRQVRTDAQPRVEMTVKTSELDADDPTAGILAHVEPQANENALARLALEGTMDRTVHHRLNLSLIEDRARELFFFCELDLSELRVRSEIGLTIPSVTRRPVAEEIDHVVDRLLRETEEEQSRAALELTRREMLAAWQQLEQ